MACNSGVHDLARILRLLRAVLAGSHGHAWSCASFGF